MTQASLTKSLRQPGLPKTQRDITCTVVVIALLAVFLYVAENFFDRYTVQVLNLMAINAILALSLNLIYGFTGMFSLGHAGFMAVGAYTCTLLLLSPEQKATAWLITEIQPWLATINTPFIVAVFLGGVMAALFGLIVALPSLRLGGDYLGIATLGFAEIIRVLIVNTNSVTNGALGIKGIPQYGTLWWNFGWLLFTLYIIISLLRSNTGNVFKAIRDDEIAASTMGVNTYFYRVLSFCIGAFFAGVGGALTATLISTIDPKMFNFLLTFNILMFVVAGGLGSITGSIVGSMLITVMLEWLRFIEHGVNMVDLAGWLPFGSALIDKFGPSTTLIPGVPGMRMVIFSVLLMCIILFRRSGLLGNREFSWSGFFNFIYSIPGRVRSIPNWMNAHSAKAAVLVLVLLYIIWLTIRR